MKREELVAAIERLTAERDAAQKRVFEIKAQLVPLATEMTRILVAEREARSSRGAGMRSLLAEGAASAEQVGGLGG
jgi:hypothetical protein